MISPLTPSTEEYTSRFERERLSVYPVVDAFEAQCGYRVNRERLDAAARVLACPVKAHSPCWAHGRVLYSVASRYLTKTAGPVSMLDIGTAKGFSALCLLWALEDSWVSGTVTSVDVIDPHERVKRNTIAEVDGYKTLAETLEPWPEAKAIRFIRSTGIDWLKSRVERLHVVFVDGKHTAAVVSQEAALILARQLTGDLCIFDDVHLPEIRAVVRGLQHSYTVEYLDILPHRGYAVAVRK